MINFIIENATLLIALSFLYAAVKWYKPDNDNVFKITSGVLFGLITIAAMMIPYEYQPGVHYDGRTVIITLVGFWLGGLSVLISAFIALLYRIYMGGVGVVPGIFIIIFSGLIGLFFRYIFRKNLKDIKFYILYLIGFTSNLSLLASKIIFPRYDNSTIIMQIWMPIVVILPVAFACVAYLFQMLDKYFINDRILKEAEELYRTTLLSIGDAVICTDKDGRINQMNRVAENITGWTFKEANGRKIEEVFKIVSEHDLKSVKNPIEEVFEKRSIVGLANHTLLIAKQGEKIPIADSGAPIIINNEIIGAVLVFRDQTKEREQKKKLIKSEKRYKEREFWLRESQRVGKIGSYDYDFKKDRGKSSEIMNEIFGFGKDEPYNYQLWMDSLHPDHKEEIVTYLADVLKNGTRFDKEYRIIRKNDKAVRWILGSGEAQFNDKGEPKRIFGTAQDITDKKKLLDDLITAKEKAEESERLKSAFLANMSHEIRTPLNGIVGFTNILASDENLSIEKRKEFAEIINKSSAGLLKIINDILDISRLETGKNVIFPKYFELGKMLLTVYNIFSSKLDENSGRSIKLEMEKPDKSITILSDEERLIQVLSNLIDNAFKFTLEGTISFGVSEYTNDDITFYVSDTGIGIPHDKLELIFDRFAQAESGYSRRYEGTGLGLSIVKKLVELLGGEIQVESTLQKGTRFEFTLPYTNTVTENIEEDKSYRTENNHTLNTQVKILIVEDDSVSRLYLKSILEAHYNQLLFAKNGKEALKLYESESPNIILMDIGLPDMTGLDVVRKIRETDQNVKIIAQTAFAMAEDRSKALAAGCDDYMSKPVRSVVLLSMLKQFTG